MKIPTLPEKIRKRKFLIPLIISVLCLVLSFFELTSHNRRMMRLVNVEKVIHRGAAAVDAHLACLDGDKCFLLPALAVVNLNHGLAPSPVWVKIR